MRAKLVQDKQHKHIRRVTIAWTRVNHPEHPDNQLALVIVCDKNKHQKPMCLLTSLKIHSRGEAWQIMHTYFHRWEAEQGFRFLTSEKGLESTRLWFWDNRMKLMAIVTLVYDFLLQMMRNWRS